MDRVQAVAVHVVRQPRGTADAGDDDDVLSRDVEFGQEGLERGEDRIVAAARVLVLGWGSTFGSIGAAVRRVRLSGGSIAQAHLRHLSPFPSNLGDVLKSYDKVLVPEINLGQLALLLRGRYLTDVISYNRVRGLPFRASELAGVIEDVIANA